MYISNIYLAYPCMYIETVDIRPIPHHDDGISFVSTPIRFSRDILMDMLIISEKKVEKEEREQEEEQKENRQTNIRILGERNVARARRTASAAAA